MLAKGCRQQVRSSSTYPHRCSRPPEFIVIVVRRALLVILGCVFAIGAEPPDTGPAEAGKTKGLDDALRNLHAPLAGGKALSPEESHKKLKVQDGLAVDLIAHEPTVRQPLHISFDERGRMWVVNYVQYPFPAGVKIVEYDRYIRAKFDKVPPPPPHHFKGADYITIHEDDGSGTFPKVKRFVEGLNIATSVLHGRGGVWVLNPPYLLFYPDKDRDDVPEGDPVVHLSGFGLEDTHAVANNLTWGPDGWIYGCQGSTCTAKVKVEIEKETKTTDFLGQAIWRYHPELHKFEIFAEGGGNTFGLEFDDEGRIYSGTNWGKYRGLHYVQGGYYVKGWGKHGPLTNPYALGWFEHMPHTGNADRLTHTFIVYGGDSLPERFRGKIIGPSALQRRIHVTRREPLGSSYQTFEEPFLLTSDDGWFRPVDLKAGPDGALYVADFYENRISHVDPRDNWDRGTGRIYRIRSENAKPQPPFDLAKKTGPELAELLGQKNKWFRQTALRIIGDRKDKSLIPLLRKNLEYETGQLALESLWALNLCGGLTDDDALTGLAHRNPMVRAWTVRLLADRGQVSGPVMEKTMDVATLERDPQVRSQLASSAKRLPAGEALPLIVTLLSHSEDVDDPHIPLLLWWAMEAHAEDKLGREFIRHFFDLSGSWQLPIVKKYMAERVVQRYALAGGDENLLRCAHFLRAAPDRGSVDLVLSGLEKAFAGRAASKFPEELKTAVARALATDSDGSHIALGVRVGDSRAAASALAIIADDKANKNRRIELLTMLGEVPQPAAVPVLLNVVRQSVDTPVRLAALTSLQRYDDPAIAATILELYAKAWQEQPDLRSAAQTLLASRPAWALAFLQAVDAGMIAQRSIPLDVVRTIKHHADERIAKLVEKHWGKIQPATAEAKRREMERLVALVKTGKGDDKAGKLVFTNTCAKCHKLFGEGGAVGPELTGYERDNLSYWIENIADPSASIRDEYLAFVVDTKDGRTLTGIIAAQDKATVTLRLGDGQTVRLAREQMEELRASPISLMPEDVLKELNDQQVRDLFAYLLSRVVRK
jgi:putative membrane-bound dehydrogenase-like protein